MVKRFSDYTLEFLVVFPGISHYFIKVRSGKCIDGPLRVRGYELSLIAILVGFRNGTIQYMGKELVNA